MSRALSTFQAVVDERNAKLTTSRGRMVRRDGLVGQVQGSGRYKVWTPEAMLRSAFGNLRSSIANSVFL